MRCIRCGLIILFLSHVDGVGDFSFLYVLLLLRSQQDAEYCDQRVCLSVCTSVCPRAYLKNNTTELHKISIFLLIVADVHSSSDDTVAW